jgi:hypothetical protein
MDKILKELRDLNIQLASLLQFLKRPQQSKLQIKYTAKLLNKI